MPDNKDKIIFYSMLERKLGNILSKTPLFWGFKDVIFRSMVNYIDPWLEAFMSGEILNVDMMGDFAAQEVQTKIEQFKQEYREKQNENKTNI